MGWGKVAIGAGLGLFLGRSWWGALMGAWVGYLFDKSQASRDPRRRHGGMDSARQYASMSNDRRSMIFCASAGAMMAKIAKADGHVSSEEIAGIEAAFRQLGFSPVARATAVKAFRNAKGDDHTIYEYASEFANVVDSVEVREYLYELPEESNRHQPLR